MRRTILPPSEQDTAVTPNGQLTFDDLTASASKAKISLFDMARDLYLEAARHAGISTRDQRLLIALEAVDYGPDGKYRSPAAVAADFLLLEILYGCEFLDDPEAVRDPYNDDSWLLHLARIGALTLMNSGAGEWLDAAQERRKFTARVDDDPTMTTREGTAAT